MVIYDKQLHANSPRTAWRISLPGKIGMSLIGKRVII